MRAAAVFVLLGLGAVPLWADAISGVVRERQGEELIALRKATVILHSTKDREVVTATKSDADGRFFLDAPAGVFRLEVRRRGYIHGQDAESLRIDCRQACGPFEVEMLRGAVLAGRAVDELGEPLEGVNVSARAQGESDEPAGGRRFRGRAGGRERSGSGHTDDRGYFRMTGIAPGVYDVTAVAATRGPTNELAKATLEGIELSAGQERDIVLTVRPERYDRFLMSGRVVIDDVAEEDLRQMRLVVRMLDGAAELRRFSMRGEAIGPGGAFTVRDLPAGRYSVGIAGRRGGRPFGQGRSLGVVNLDHDLTGLSLTPLPPSGVAGRIRFVGDDPPSRFAFLLRPAEGGRPGGRGGGQFISAAMPEFTFRSDNFEPGEYRVEARERGLFVVEVLSAGKPLPAGTIRIVEGEIHDLELVVSDQTASVSGSLRRREGGPAAFVEVVIRDGRGESTVQTDQNGRFAFEDVHPGPVVVSAESLRREFAASAGADIDIDLTLEP